MAVRATFPATAVGRHETALRFPHGQRKMFLTPGRAYMSQAFPQLRSTCHQLFPGARVVRLPDHRSGGSRYPVAERAQFRGI
eukprot:4503248-Pyramimonas_sp.AAC.1